MPKHDQHRQHDGTHTATDHDPICGMQVNPDSAAGVAEYEGRRYFFCSTHCKERFEADPARYVGQIGPPHSASAEGKPAGAYTCPMHPDERQHGPGDCAQCGMALELLKPAAPRRATEYICPMHPEVRQSGPGACPI